MVPASNCTPAPSRDNGSTALASIEFFKTCHLQPAHVPTVRHAHVHIEQEANKRMCDNAQLTKSHLSSSEAFSRASAPGPATSIGSWCENVRDA